MNLTDLKCFLDKEYTEHSIRPIIVPNLASFVGSEASSGEYIYAGYLTSYELFRYELEGNERYSALETIQQAGGVNYVVAGTGVYKTNNGHPNVVKPNVGFQLQDPAVLTIRYEGNIHTYAVTLTSQSAWYFANNNPGIPNLSNVEILSTNVLEEIDRHANHFNHVIFDKVLEANKCTFIGFKIERTK